MQGWINLILQVITFISDNIMVIRIGNITLLGWIIALILISAVIMFVLNHSKEVHKPSIKPRKRRENSENE